MGNAPVSVWLVEDNHVFRNTVVRVLSHIDGIECPQHFSNAEDVLDAMLGGGVPDVILLDVELPGQNGIDAIQKIKSISPSTRIVMLTVFDNHEKIFKAICAGASGYLLKTSSLEQIIESIHEMAQPKQGYRLTEREKTILDLMTHGLCKKEIAGQLSLSYHTVDTHLRNIYAKLHVHSCTGAVAIVLKERFL